MTRSEALERYRSLPVPGTDDEPWRFTDLRGFDPDAFTAAPGRSRGPSRCSSSTSPGSRTSARAGSRSSARRRAYLRAAREDHPRLHELVGWDEKFAAHNAAAWQAGLLVRVPKGVVVEQPLYVRVANAVDDGSLFWRLLVEVEESASLTLIEEYASARPDLRGYSNAVAELFVGQNAKLEYVSIQNLSNETWHFATHHARVDRDAELDWVAGGFGSKKGKVRIQNDLAGPGATSRVTGAYFADGSSTSTTTPSRSTSRRGRSATSPSRARCATGRRRCGAG